MNLGSEQMTARQKIAEAWAKRLEGEETTLPSGVPVIMKPVSLLGLVEQGKIPNHLLGMTQKMLEDRKENSTPEQVIEMAQLARIIVCEVLMYPQVCTFTLKRDADGKIVKENDKEVYEEEPESLPDKISFSRLADIDVVYIVNAASQGLNALKDFRSADESAGAIGQDSAAVQPTPIDAARS